MPAPANPAPVSGPGRLAKRTDGQKLRQLPNAEYGEQAEYQSTQRVAPMSAGPDPVPSGASGATGGGAGPALTPLNAPTSRPGEPITAGADIGAGPGSSALGLPDPNADVKQRLLAIYSQYPTEDLRELLEAMD